MAFTAGSHSLARHCRRFALLGAVQLCASTETSSLFIAAWHSFCVEKPALVSRRRSSVSRRAPPHLGQPCRGRRSSQNLLLQTSTLCRRRTDVDDVLPGSRPLAALSGVTSHASPRHASTLSQQLRSEGCRQQRDLAHRKHGGAADREPVRCAPGRQGGGRLAFPPPCCSFGAIEVGVTCAPSLRPWRAVPARVVPGSLSARATCRCAVGLRAPVRCS